MMIALPIPYPGEAPIPSEGTVIDGIPIPGDFEDQPKPSKRKKNIDISVD